MEMTIGMQFLYIPLLSVFLSFQFSDIEKCVKVFPGIVQDRVFSGEWGFGIENLTAGFSLYQSQYLSFFQSQQFSGIKIVLQFSWGTAILKRVAGMFNDLYMVKLKIRIQILIFAYFSSLFVEH